MGLGQTQRVFTRCVAELILHAYELGYEVSLGDAYRDPRVHGDWGVRGSYSAARSVHKLRLAVDLNLFRDGEYLTATADHRPLGEWWEKKGEEVGLPLRWGGRFSDGNHYSCEMWGKM